LDQADEKLLDLDKLHEIMSPPDFDESPSNKKSSGNTSRRSERAKKSNNDAITVINCHQCKKIESTLNILTCGNENCRESYCLKCIKNYYVKNIFLFYFIKNININFSLKE
jgi:hypothetical protein